MLDKSKKENAYLLVDLDTVPEQAALDAVAALNEVIRVRVILKKNSIIPGSKTP